MYSFPSLSSSSILRAHIRQDIALIFVSENQEKWDFPLLRKYSYLCTSLLAFFSFLPTSGYAAPVTQEFIVTAYYSPLPDQSWYSKGTYEAEKILNGEGTHGASGKPVFMGMVAAPKTYAFGTRIDFQGLGVGIVEDRGGAIVKAGERGQSSDRIDIWMGVGESGLIRARSWGKRKVIGTIIEDSSKALLNFRDIDTGKVDINMYGRVLGASSNYLSDEVLNMFRELGYDNDGGDVRAMIMEFQKDHGIIKSSTDDGAGVYGPRTQASLAKEYSQYSTLRETELKKIEAEKALLISERNQWAGAYEKATEKIATLGSPKRGDKGAHVRVLQGALKSTGYFKGKESGTMNGMTILALKSLQKSHGISPTGTIDTSTREILLAAIAETI